MPPPSEVRQRWFNLFQRELQVTVHRFVEFEEGWDSLVVEINGEWIVRVPRRPDIEQLLRKEVRLVEVLANALPLPVPRLRLVTDDDLCFVAYRKIVGTRIDLAISSGADERLLGTQLGGFLAELHRFPRERAIAAGLPARDAEAWRSDQRAFQERCTREVYPLLAGNERRRADEMFDGYFSAGADELDLCVVHADLGPAHILCREKGVSGVIDWSDAQLGDPAIDFGWSLHGVSSGFAEALQQAYARAGGQFDDAFCARARFYHRLGPWYEVIYGLDQHAPRFIDSGLAGVRARLPS